MTKRRDWSWLYIVLLACLPLLFYWRILTPNPLDRGSFPQGDFAEQFYAFGRFAYDELSQGRLPLWNPYTFAGHPFLADVQSAVFYPPSLILMAVATWLGGYTLYALEWQAVLHFSLAGIFTFLFARHEFGLLEPRSRSRSLANLAALLSALIFTFGGYLTSYPPQQLALLETDIWLPLILWCIGAGLSDVHRGTPDGGQAAWSATNRPLQAIARRPLAPIAIAGAVFGVALLAGHPQSALYLLIVSAAYLLFLGRSRGWRWRDLAVQLAWMLLIALGVSATQWLPSLEFMQASSRSSLSYADYARGFELQDPLQVLLPGSVSLYSPLYIGIVPLALVLCALWLPRRPRRVVWFWLALALFALALSFGGNLFLYPILYLFAPGFALFRQQERAAFIFSFALAMLSGYGALALVHSLPHDGARRLRALARLSLGTLMGSLFFFIVLYFGWSVAQLDAASPWRDASVRAAWLLLMLVVWVGLLALRRRAALHGSLLLGALVLATALDLFSVNGHTNFQPTFPETQTAAPAFLAPLLADHTPFRTYNEFRVFGNFGDMFHVEDAWGASPLRLARYDQFSKLPMQRLWPLLNVKYVITWRQSLAELGVQSEVVATQKISDKETTYVHRLLNVSPRAVVVSRADVAASSDDALNRLAAPEFNFTRQAILETPLAAPLAGLMPGTATLLARQPDHYTWSFTAPSAALFVLSENFYPGWRAYVAGREVPVIRVNSIMLGVPVPAGSGTAEFVFDPMSVKMGLAISLLSLLGLLAWLLWHKLTGRTGTSMLRRSPPQV